MEMSKKKPELHVGQTIYVEITSWWSSSKPTEPKEFIVTKVNTRSIYARPKDSSFEYRFDKNTWRHDTGIGDMYYIWLSPDDYWSAVKRMEDKKALRSRIASELSSLSLKKLQEVANLLDIKLK